MGMWVRQDKLAIAVLALLAAVCILIFGYEVYVYSQRTGKGYQWMYVSQAEQDEMSYLRIVIRGARPEKVTRAGKKQDIADSVTYREKRKVGQVTVRLSGEDSLDFYFSGERDRKVTVSVWIVDQGREVVRQRVTLGFVHGTLDVLRRSKHGCLRIRVVGGRELDIAAREGVRVVPADQTHEEPADEDSSTEDSSTSEQ